MYMTYYSFHGHHRSPSRIAIIRRPTQRLCLPPRQVQSNHNTTSNARSGSCAVIGCGAQSTLVPSTLASQPRRTTSAPSHRLSWVPTSTLSSEPIHANALGTMINKKQSYDVDCIGG